MRILYYLEPFHEFGNPLFRFATVRNHLEREIRGLARNTIAAVEVVMLCSEPIAAAVRAHGFLAEVRLVTVSQDELRRIYPDYLEASARWYNRDFSRASMDRMAELCSDKLRGFEPDVIVCYESNAPFLEELFPEALFLHNTLGIFSRDPYPETSALDPFGIGKDAFLCRYGARLRDVLLSADEQRRLDDLKRAYQSVLLQHSPLRAAQVRRSFEHVVLLPLQVSRYFMFDENCPPALRGANQLDLVRYVLERVDPQIGVYVTLHGAEAALFTGKVLHDLERRFPNFLFSREVQRVRWPSQHVLPHVDAVVTVSSSVGLQALIWDLPTIVLGRSHLTGIATAGALSELSALLASGEPRDLDGALYYLLTHYYPPMDRYHHRGDWFMRFLERGVARRKHGLDFDFYEPIDDPDVIFHALMSDLRVAQYTSELRRGPQVEPTEHVCEPELVQSIASAELVSFDVFDTLVTRPLSHPRAVFDLLAPKARALFEQQGVSLEHFGSFRSLREDSAKQAAQRARELDSEEYELTTVYELLCARVGAPAALAAPLKQLEEEIELAIHAPRSAGQRLFQEALRQRKRVVLLSDIFLETAIVAEILRRCGYQGYQRLYVSSEFGLLKKTGRLYDRVRQLEGNPQPWVHFGDNRLADVRVPTRRGIRAHHLPSISDLYSGDAHVVDLWSSDAALPSVTTPEDFASHIGSALQHGVISRKFYDRPGRAGRRSRFEGSAYRLGYEAGGPLLLSFVLWIAEKARREKLTDIYFLSRDGHLPKRIYELITRDAADAPRSHYLYASRRAYSVASLRSAPDIAASLDLRSSVLKLAELLRHRFGIDPADLDPGTLAACGFLSWDEVVDCADAAQRRRLQQFLAQHSEPILARAAQEREALLEYLRQEGLLDETRRLAVVDIGHNASLQVALAGLTGRSDLKGYYFATFYPALRAYREGFDISAYLLEFEDSKTSDHVYCKNIGLFEFLFLPADRSLSHFAKGAHGAVQPVFVEGDESKRFLVAAEVHRGVVDFCKDVVAASAGQPWLFEIPKNDAMRGFARFAAQPDRADAALLDGVSFVDAAGGSLAKYLIATPLFESVNVYNFSEFERLSWWKAGARAVVQVVPGRPYLSSALVWQRKLRKLWRDPRRFVADMKLTQSVLSLWPTRPNGRR